MDDVFLVLMVAVIGSSLLPAMRLGRVFKKGRTRSTSPYYRVSCVQLEPETDMSLRVQGEPMAGRETIGEIKKQTDYPLAPSAGTGDFEFRSLTEEEKKEFVNSLDAKGKQLSAELSGKAKSASDSELANTTSPTLAS